MKLLFATIMVLALIPGQSQQAFQGSIVYNLHSSTEEPDAQLVIYFGEKAVKLKFLDPNDPDAVETLIRLDSGKIYTLHVGDKTFQSKSMIECQDGWSSLPMKKIAGFSTTPDTLPEIDPLSLLLGRMFLSAQKYVFVADSLFYPVPGKYASNIELAFVREGRIVLGVTVTGRFDRFFDNEDDDNEASETEVSAEAISVSRTPLPEKEFSIPPDFVKSRYEDMIMEDSTTVIEEMKVPDSSVIVVDPSTQKTPEPIPQKKPATKPKKKTGNIDIKKPD